MTRMAALGAFAALLAGCNGGKEGPDRVPTWHSDVRPIFERTCTNCHTAEGGITGIPLTNFEEATAWSEPIAEAVAAGTMPPWNADKGCSDYEGDFSLEDDDVRTILDWVAGNTPEGNVKKAAPAEDPWIPTVLDRVDFTMEMPEPFTPTASPDDYRCVILDWPEDETVWVTGYNFIAGNADLVHHVIPFIIPAVDADDFRELDDAEPGAGYTCFGGPGGDIDSLIEATWLGGWAPGVGASVLPEGYGLEVEAGSIVVLQVHYNAPPGNTASDQSSFEVQVERVPLKGAIVQPWTDIAWVLGVGMDIPAGAVDVEHNFAYAAEYGGIEIHNAALHMHTLGRTAKLSLKHDDGSETCILSHSNYDFNWQRDYRLTDPITIEYGDTVELTCTWDNPTDELVRWGDGTGDEMCLAVTLMTWD